MKTNYAIALLTAAALVLAATPSFAKASEKPAKEITKFSKTSKSKNPVVGGAEMFSDKPILENLATSSEHSMFTSAMKAAGQDQLLSTGGPFTVFAPDNRAFAEVPKETIDMLHKTENKGKLVNMLQYHIVPGNYSIEDLESKATKNTGKVSLVTLEGETVILAKGNKKGSWTVTDVKGDKAQVTIAGVKNSNGTVFVVDTVLMPSR